MNLGDVLDRGEEHARNILLTRGEKSLTAFYHLYGPAENAIVPCTWRNEIEKQVTILGVKELARKIGAIAVLMISEAWMVVELETAPRPPWADPPAQDPSRVEVVTILASDGVAARQRVLRIIRDKPGGRITSLAKDEDEDRQIGVESRLIDGVIEPAGGAAA